MAGSDFSITAGTVNFPVGARRGDSRCVNSITIINDDGVELKEDFLVTLTSNRPVGNSLATITIIDDDGKRIS